MLDNDFEPVKGGDIYNKKLIDLDYGYWWSSTPGDYSETKRYYLAYNRSNLLEANTSVERFYGFYIRCIARD